MKLQKLGNNAILTFSTNINRMRIPKGWNVGEKDMDGRYEKCVENLVRKTGHNK
jgi:hypothetical protein